MAEQKEMFHSPVANNGKANPSNYRRLCEPFESMEVANNAAQAFWEEFYELRNKHHIADCLVICRFAVATDKGEGIVHMRMHAGDEMHAENMAAFALGAAQVERQEATARFIRKSLKQIKAKK